MKSCPVCGTKEGVREFVYGEPIEEPDPTKYIVGGCSISEDAPDYRCILCATDFYKNSQKFTNRFIWDGTGINFICKECKGLVPTIEDLEWHICLT